MTEIELKQYVFAMYIGQQVLLHPDDPSNPIFLYGITWNEILTCTDRIGDCFERYRYDENCPDFSLQLRPLSSITDQEAIEVAKASGCLENIPEIQVKIGHNYVSFLINETDEAMNWRVYQYLQQQSFALPIYFKGEHYSVERLVSDGIITFKN